MDEKKMLAGHRSVTIDGENGGGYLLKPRFCIMCTSGSFDKYSGTFSR